MCAVRQNSTIRVKVASDNTRTNPNDNERLQTITNDREHIVTNANTHERKQTNANFIMNYLITNFKIITVLFI